MPNTSSIPTRSAAAARRTQNRRPADLAALGIRFGVEIETKLPVTAAVAVGGYHAGTPVVRANSLAGTTLEAPLFRDGTGSRLTWRADRDGSITCEPGQMAAEFVSPILHGVEGVQCVKDFCTFLRQIGAEVDGSCGVHITVGIESIIGSKRPEDIAEFVRKVAHIAQWHSMALYGQTGSGRHLSRYSHTLAEDVATQMRRAVRIAQSLPASAGTLSGRSLPPDTCTLNECARACGRGMLNFQKAFLFTPQGEYKGALEFRVFAGTTDAVKILHHIACVIGLCRRAHQVQCLGAFKKNKLQSASTVSAAKAIEFLWSYLGWTDAKRDCALGLFGPAHAEWPALRDEARRLCVKFDERFPEARL